MVFLCPTAKPGRTGTALNRRVQESVQEQDVDWGARDHLGGRTGHAAVWPGGYLHPLPTW